MIFGGVKMLTEVSTDDKTSETTDIPKWLGVGELGNLCDMSLDYYNVFKLIIMTLKNT